MAGAISFRAYTHRICIVHVRVTDVVVAAVVAIVHSGLSLNGSAVDEVGPLSGFEVIMHTTALFFY